MKKFLLLLLLLLPWTIVSAQEVEDDAFTPDTASVADSIPEQKQLYGGLTWEQLTPDQQWMYRLQERLDSVLRTSRVTTVTYTKGRGRRARRYTKTVQASYRVGVSVFDLTADSILYGHNASDGFIPASNEKLFTGITALSTLGKDYHFQTKIYIRGRIKTDTLYVALPDTTDTLPHPVGESMAAADTLEDVTPQTSYERDYLDGDVYICSGFDPLLDKQAVTYVAGKIMALDVDSIAGHIYAYEPQKSIIDRESWFWSRHPSKYFASSLVETLRDNGIAFSSRNPFGTISTPILPQGTAQTGEGKDSETGDETDEEDVMDESFTLVSPLTNALPRMMKNSDNYYAESVLLNLLPPQDVEHWSYEGCKEQVRRMVRQVAGSDAGFNVSDGSGLSHSNRSTPLLLTQMLRYAYHHPNIFDPLYQTLPIAGVDGTLVRRLKGTRGYNNVRAKTGTVSGVSTLSGYLTASNGHFLAFSILVNNVSSSKGKDIQNRLCIEMTR